MSTNSTKGVTEPDHADLDRLVREGVRQAQAQVRQLLDEHVPIPPRFSYPSLDHFESGQPRVTHGKGPINYAGVFTQTGGERGSVAFDKVPALAELGQLAIEDESLRARLLAPEVAVRHELSEWFVKTGAARIPLEIFDRLMTTVGNDFTDDDLEGAWKPLRNGLLWDKLPVDIVVPVCLTTFDLTHPLDLAGRVRLEPLPEGEQRARVPTSIWDAAANECVVAAATHAITIYGYEVPGRNRMLLEYGRAAFYPVEEIEQAFEALRIAASVPMGYAQIYMRPIGWAWHYSADLPPVIQGSIARRYPPQFDDYGWLRQPESTTRTEVNDAATTLAELSAAGKSLRLASRRFSGAALRADEDDAVLDLCIAIEAALGDEDRSEMNYKLSLRAAAILALQNVRQGDAPAVMKRVKDLYGWRSAIVHGRDVEKARRKFLGDDAGNGLEAATTLVRSLLRQLVLRNDLRSGDAIDTKLLLGTGLNRYDQYKRRE
jgi:hypothetical protein